MVNIENLEMTIFSGLSDVECLNLKSLIESNAQSIVMSDYLELLKVSDGFIGNNIIFYGSKSRDRLGYELPSIVKINEIFWDNKINGQFIIARIFDMFLIFKSEELKYQIVLPTTLIVIKEFDEIVEVIEYINDIIKE